MTNHPPRRGICRGCGDEFGLKTDGTVRGHGWDRFGQQWCVGAWQPPAEPVTAAAIPWAAGDSTLRSGVSREEGAG